jgi:hypothetical protein
LLPIMKRILSGVLRRENGVVQRNGRAGALRIEFIERSRNEPLGIEWLFAAHGAECGGAAGRLEYGWAASSVKDDRDRGVAEISRQAPGLPKTEIC